MGATLKVEAPAFTILSSGPMSYPPNRPLISVFSGKPKIVCVASVDMFSDEYLEKEDNSKILV